MLPLYSVTLFLSAALLFLVQPMVAKQLLPRVGGAPAVWNTCMAFFQAALLAGYAYTHAGTALLGSRRHAVLHCLVLLAALVLLPIGLASASAPAPGTVPIVWLVGRLALSVGGPFFVVSATAPLLQRWFAEAGHPASRDPYFLYAASNLGSMAALIGYPLLVEPNLRLAQQSWLWSAGYGLLVLLSAACAAALWRSKAAPLAGVAAPDKRVKRDKIGWGRRLRWLALSFVPSSWLLGVTTHLTTDIAPAPLLWIIPLAVYLLSFILVFARQPPLPHLWMTWLLPVAALGLVAALLLPAGWPALALHLAAFFIGAMACHGELAADRPPPQRLTEFYLWMSLGGVAGGVFNGLLAPLLFPWMIEYPLAVMLACLLCPPRRAAEAAPPPRASIGGLWGFLLRPSRIFALLITLPLVAEQMAPPFPGEVIFRGRGYFGLHRVVANGEGSDRYHHLVHGTTIHGRQSLDPSRRCEPLTYYHPTGPVGQVFAVLDKSGQPRRVALVGLGTGAMASYAGPGDEFTFYEIDPLVERVAQDPKYFSFLSGCSGGTCRVELGDGRLKLAEAADGAYDLIVLDAFSSDAVPIHLLTREAVRLYLAKSTPHGVLLFHTTNNHLDLEGVLANLAADAGLVALAGRDLEITVEAFNAGKAPSSWLVMARQEKDLGGLAQDRRWQPIPLAAGAKPWSDDFSNIAGALKWW